MPKPSREHSEQTAALDALAVCDPWRPTDFVARGLDVSLESLRAALTAAGYLGANGGAK